mmetsp:Transcript_21348/g.34173  ORF Transcript_21348/g.34173 Transcript_21348/m.34173 type:complete len:459 (-) Transcript_21348:210-1586(-)
MAVKYLCAVIALLLEIKSTSSASVLIFSNPPPVPNQQTNANQMVPNQLPPLQVPPPMQPLYNQMYTFVQQQLPQIAPQIPAEVPQSVIYGAPPPDFLPNVPVTLPSGHTVTFVYKPPEANPANTPATLPEQPPILQPPQYGLGAAEHPPPEPPITPPANPEVPPPQTPPALPVRPDNGVEPPPPPISPLPPLQPPNAPPNTENPPPVRPVPPVAAPQPERPQFDGQPQAQAPVINAAKAQNMGDVVDTEKVDIKTIASGQQHEMDDIDLTLSQQSQIMIALLMAFFFGCTMMRCCCNSKAKRYARYSDDGQLQQRGGGNGSVEADIDWSDNTEDEDPEEQAAATAFPFRVQQSKNERAMAQKKQHRGFEQVADESRDDRMANMEIMEEADIQILMEEDAVRPEEEMDDEDEEEEDSHYKQYARGLRRRFMGRSQDADTDDETRSIMREFKDSDDEYVD